MSHAKIIILLLAMVSFISCGQTQKSAYFEGWTSDLVGQSEEIGPDGREDVQISLTVEAPGPVIRILVRNINGQVSNWDTIPRNASWVAGVADKERPDRLLNGGDGSILIPVREKRDLLLFLADNGAFRKGETDFEVVVTYHNGREESYRVERSR